MVRSVIPIIFLIAIPLAIITNIDYTEEGYKIIVGSAEVTFHKSELAFILVFAYAFYPLIYSSEKLFKEKNMKSLINEYKWVKRILFLEFPLMIILLVIIFSYPQESQSSSYYPQESRPLFHESLAGNLAYPVLAGIIWILIVRKKGYQYYFAKAYVSKSLEKNDSIEKIKDFNNSIKYYNKYLQSNIGNRITKMDEIKSKFSDINVEEQNNIIRSLSQAFETADKGKPKEILKNIFNIEIVQINNMDKIKHIFSEKGIVVIIIFPVLNLVISNWK